MLTQTRFSYKGALVAPKSHPGNTATFGDFTPSASPLVTLLCQLFRLND